MKTIRHLADVLPRYFGAQFRYQLIMAKKLLMKENEVLAEAAIRAGLKAYFGYPIRRSRSCWNTSLGNYPSGVKK
ncbi:MAG: hypothetical protein IIA61_00665 [Candidatus Marinimicrobia bacterium]|nr:hypothetical protein [Candidatus Neomarinimicrobiota bacterium]